MDGLEITEIYLSEIYKRNRIDSEYYQYKYIKNENILMNLPNFKIGEKYKVTDGEHGSVEYLESGVRYLTAENIKRGYVDISNVKYVSKEVDIRNARASVEVGDVLISIKGTLGEIAVAEEWLLPCNMNRDVAIIKAHNKDNAFSDYLAIFLMSKYGANQSERGGSGGVQQMITLERLRTFIVPEFSDDFYKKIKELYNNSQVCLALAKKCFWKAEQILIDDIGMNDFQECQDKVAIKMLSESWGTTSRLDSEYYQKKYEDIYKKIYNYSNGYEELSSICYVKDTNYIPKDKETYKYIELSNIGKEGEINGCTIDLGNNLPTRARRLINKGDVIVSSVGGSLSSCALVTEEYDNSICSNGFYVVNSTKINSETLLLLFKSKPIQSLLKKGCSGTILIAISKDEFKSKPIPIIKEKTQIILKEKIEECFRLRRESKLLIDKAKVAVEIAIEHSENEAIKYINS
ncbi:restriction endonuclease subunit S [Clostridium botulinum]|uniref:hypothetical protein n=1 Tax=Clostridium TaxID=1485 RepID=UPI0013CD0A79|nr:MULTISPECIES: hypothetical protein [Clostridium]MCS6132256.1 restriction endonuclease subunit S [Clostridium botulinum]NFL45676.1 restriction endonuclease subunit S [Clostridium botulinum]NFL90573.1 restriction endonuclease subunit S [Clostridium botulinum]NFN29938.1 restriction endonuclease subunit S [Clostridium botulinum]NFO50298.1 restriction endonuclease subunit S [Clostridium botulinum]